MAMETLIVVGVLARCLLDVVNSATYRWRLRARHALLAAAATLPPGIEVTERASDGSVWRATATAQSRKEPS